MNKLKEVNYDEFKKTALNFEPIQKKVLLSQIEVGQDGSLSIEGLPVKTDDGVVEKQLLKTILSINPKLLKAFEKGLNPTAKVEFISLIKGALALSDVKKSQVSILGNARTGNITNILPGDRDFISNRMNLELFEKTMNAAPDLKLVNATVNHNGSIEMNVQKGVIVTPKTKNLLKGEEFNPGFTFRNSPLKGTNVDYFTTRLVCTNGMTARGLKNTFNLNVLDDTTIRTFFEKFLQMNKENFVPEFYAEQIEKASFTRASFYEIMNARNIMVMNSDLKLKGNEAELNMFLPEFTSVSAELARKGVDYAEKSDKQLMNYPTKYNVWDVVNRVTDFGSHDYGFNASFNHIQTQAGDLFNKKVYDTQNLILV